MGAVVFVPQITMSKVVILMYHVVAEPRSAEEIRYCCRPSQFDAQMRHIRDSGLPRITLDDLTEAFEGRRAWPDKGVAVTFDDGFAETFVNALPILLRHGIPATMFALSDGAGANNDWMASRGYPRRRLMSTAKLREMSAAGVAIGSHTRSHPHLRELDSVAKRREIDGSKTRLQEVLGRDVSVFAYPYGEFDDDARRIVQEAGYRAACSVRSGFNAPTVDRFALRRIEVKGSDNMWQFRQKLKFGASDMTWSFPLRYYAGRLRARLPH